MELSVKEFNTPKIDFNFDDLKTQATQVLEKYKDLVFTEETMKDGKETRAKLNELKTSVENKRKEIKKKINEPYVEFETKIKEITSLIDEPILAIDTQIKTFESKKKEEKKNEITEIYNQAIGDLKEILPLERIFNEKWLNATTTIKSITTEINSVIEKTNNDLNVLDTLNSEFVTELKNSYLNTLDLSKTLQLKAELEERKKAFEERQKQQPVQEKPKVEIKEVAKAEAKEIKKYSFKVEIIATVEQKDLFKTFLLNNNIEFRPL